MRARVVGVLLFAAVLAGTGLAGACGGSPPPPEGFGIAEAERARRALADLPRAVEQFRAGRYGLAAEGFGAVLAALPPADHAAPAAALLALDGPAGFRRLRSSVETNLGLCHLRARRYEAAIAVLEQAVATDPGSPTAHSNLGVALLRTQRPDAARRSLEEAVRRGGAGVRLHLNLGEAALRAGDPGAARRALLETVRLARAAAGVDARGARLEAERLLAEAAAGEGDLEEAQRRLEAVLAESPGDPLPRYLLLRVLVRLGDRAGAERHAERFARDAATLSSVQAALAEDPDEAAGLHWVADSYLALGLDHLADVHYRQLLARDPDDAAARRGLVAVHSRLPTTQNTGPTQQQGDLR